MNCAERRKPAIYSQRPRIRAMSVPDVNRHKQRSRMRGRIKTEVERKTPNKWKQRDDRGLVTSSDDVMREQMMQVLTYEVRG